MREQLTSVANGGEKANIRTNCEQAIKPLMYGHFFLYK